MNDPTTDKQVIGHKADDSTPRASGKNRCRVKPRQLSALARQLILEQFLVRHSSEDVAEDAGLPVRCVTDVIMHAALMSERAQSLRRKIA